MKKEIFTWILAMFTELLKVLVVALVVIALVLAFGQVFTLAPQACHYHCVTCENAAKTESGSEIHIEGIITEVWVKAGQGCFLVPNECYATVAGGVGYDFVIVEKVGDGPECQDISHIEVCYDVENTPTSTNTQEPTATFTQTPESTATFTQTPTSTSVETSTPTETQEPSVTPTVTPEETRTPVPERTPNGNGCG